MNQGIGNQDHTTPGVIGQEEDTYGRHVPKDKRYGLSLGKGQKTSDASISELREYLEDLFGHTYFEVQEFTARKSANMEIYDVSVYLVMREKEVNKRLKVMNGEVISVANLESDTS